MCTEKAVAFFPSQDTVAAPWWMRNLARGAAKSSGSLLHGCWQMATWGFWVSNQGLVIHALMDNHLPAGKTYGAKRGVQQSQFQQTQIWATPSWGMCSESETYEETWPTPWKNRQENKRRHMKWAKEETQSATICSRQNNDESIFKCQLHMNSCHFSVPTCPAVKSLSWQDGFWLSGLKKNQMTSLTVLHIIRNGCCKFGFAVLEETAQVTHLGG